MTNLEKSIITETTTDAQRFWATDIAMMVQPWLRTGERSTIKRHHLDPALL